MKKEKGKKMSITGIELLMVRAKVGNEITCKYLNNGSNLMIGSSATCQLTLDTMLRYVNHYFIYILYTIE